MEWECPSGPPQVLLCHARYASRLSGGTYPLANLFRGTLARRNKSAMTLDMIDRYAIRDTELASSPGSPIFLTCTRKDEEPGKTYHVRDVRWNQLYIWHNSKLAKIKATDAKSSSSSIGMLQSATNQQAETLQSLFYESKTAICMVTRSCPRPGGTKPT